MDTYNKKVYWSASTSGDIFSANFDGSNQQTIINSSYARQLFVRVIPPIIVTITGKSGTSVSLSWTDVADETGYEIQRSTNKFFSTFTTFTVGANTTTYTDTTVQPLTTYYYRVRAMKQ